MAPGGEREGRQVGTTTTHLFTTQARSLYTTRREYGLYFDSIPSPYIPTHAHTVYLTLLLQRIRNFFALPALHIHMHSLPSIPAYRHWAASPHDLVNTHILSPLFAAVLETIGLNSFAVLSARTLMNTPRMRHRPPPYMRRNRDNGGKRGLRPSTLLFGHWLLVYAGGYCGAAKPTGTAVIRAAPTPSGKGNNVSRRAVNVRSAQECFIYSGRKGGRTTLVA